MKDSNEETRVDVILNNRRMAFPQRFVGPCEQRRVVVGVGQRDLNSAIDDSSLQIFHFFVVRMELHKRCVECQFSIQCDMLIVGVLSYIFIGFALQFANVHAQDFHQLSCAFNSSLTEKVRFAGDGDQSF